MERKNYRDLVKAHRMYVRLEERCFLYGDYMKSRDAKKWFESGDVPMKEIFLLFGFILGQEPGFQGAPGRFREIYKEIFPHLKAFRGSNLVNMELPVTIKTCIASIFDKVAGCAGAKRDESDAASQILRALMPELFVIWDSDIRKNIINETGENLKRDGNAYAFEFLPRMQEELREILGCKNNGYRVAFDMVSEGTDGYTLAELIYEFNHVRYALGKSLADIRYGSLNRGGNSHAG